MCGIFGIVVSGDFALTAKDVKHIVDLMFKLSESRGKEASGLSIKIKESIYVLKEPVSSSKLIKTSKYAELFNKLETECYTSSGLQTPFVVLGHSRLQTNGQSEINTNNQPVVKDGAIGIHNGIIVNDEKIWASFPNLKKQFDVDTEVFLSLLQLFRSQGQTIEQAVSNVFKSIEGSASVAIQFADSNNLVLASNTGSLYLCFSNNGKMLVFASEKYTLDQILGCNLLKNLLNNPKISQVKAGQGYVVDSNLTSKKLFSINEYSELKSNVETGLANCLKIIELYDTPTNSSQEVNLFALKEKTKQSMLRTWEELYSKESRLKRCTRCLLPETMPYISFDEEGVCCYCRDYEIRGNYLKGEKALETFISKYRSKLGEPDVLVGFSGGRDSAFGLDYIKNNLGLHPIAFTYDWGMVNDLARRNQARVVGKLGIEHIVISADIKTKRSNIRKNLKAWLKRPELGMVPILMAGDKQFYYYFHKIRKQTGIKLFIFCGGYEGEEGTGLFKYGFCNVSTQGKKNALARMTGISKVSKLKLLYYFFKQFLLNPGYFNKSMLDTLFAYYSSYVLPDDYLYLFHYLDWDERNIVDTITKKLNWEKETDTIATWRTDDGTAAFYNYIYLTMAGFTEFDIFRSHQIREGKLTREQAIEIVKEENKPRFKSIDWYGQAIALDMNNAIEIINLEPKLYQKSVVTADK
jgi:glutamine---fructose-6-phosphate transaminase (isomerizing)